MRIRPPRTHAHLASLLLAGALVPLAACSRSSSAPAVPVASGTIVEAEPNDSAADANFVGRLWPGGRVRVLGRMSPFDTYDGFAFIAGEPLSVSFVLRAADPLADLDVCLYDPYIDLFVACFEAPGGIEVGSFDVLDPGVEFHVVVAPFVGSTDYELELVATCCSAAPVGLSATAPEAEAAEAAEVGRLRATAHGAGGPTGRDAARLEAYRTGARRGEATPAEDGEEDAARAPARTPAVLLELDEAGRIDAQPVELIERRPPGR